MLLRIAANCRRVPEHPPESFYEAIQFLPEDTLIVMLQPMLLWGQSSDEAKYDTFLEMYYAIVNAKAQ